MPEPKVLVPESAIPRDGGHGLTARGLPQALFSDIASALLSAGAIPRIQAALLHELQACGWTGSLRAFVLDLIRTGECSTYDEIMTRVLAEARGDDATSPAGEHGERARGRSSDDGAIRLPDKVVREGLRVVRKELDDVVDVDLDGD